MKSAVSINHTIFISKTLKKEEEENIRKGIKRQTKSVPYFQAVAALCLFAAVHAAPEAEADADAYYGAYGYGLAHHGYGYGLAHHGYGYGLAHHGYGLGYGYAHPYAHFGYYGKRSADAEAAPAAEADADAYYGYYARPYAYGHHAYGYAHRGYYGHPYGYGYGYYG